MTRTRVFICSPYRGDRDKHADYLDACMADSLFGRGEAPFAPHALYPAYLNDEDDVEREAGISCGLAWMGLADVVAAYTDLGISDGMERELSAAIARGIPFEFRTAGAPWKET